MRSNMIANRRCSSTVTRLQIVVTPKYLINIKLRPFFFTDARAHMHAGGRVSVAAGAAAPNRPSRHPAASLRRRLAN